MKKTVLYKRQERTRPAKLSKSKYNARKVTIDGHVFDSAKEARRYQELKLLEAAGEIRNIELQRKFTLIPAQYEIAGYTKTGKLIKKCVERECTYLADFCYLDKFNIFHVEDVKSPATKTPQYII